MNTKAILINTLKTLGLTVGLMIVFIVGAMVSGLGQGAQSTTGAATAASPPAPPPNFLLWLFLSSLVQAMVVAYLVLESKWAGWKTTGALFLVVFNVWVQSAVESLPYLSGHVPENFSLHALVMGLVNATLFAPLAVWIFGGFRRAVPNEQPVRWPASRWAATLVASIIGFVALYYLCGHFIAWQNPELRQFYAGTTELRSFWGQMASIWSSMPWMFAFQAARALVFVALTLPAVRMLRGGAPRVALGTALLYAVWDGSAGLLIPNPILPPSVAHSHMIELFVWGLLFGALVGWLVGRHAPEANADQPVPKAA